MGSDVLQSLLNDTVEAEGHIVRNLIGDLIFSEGDTDGVSPHDRRAFRFYGADKPQVVKDGGMELARYRMDIFGDLDELALYLRHRVHGLREYCGHFAQIQLELSGLDRKDRQPLRQVIMEFA